MFLLNLADGIVVIIACACVCLYVSYANDTPWPLFHDLPSSSFYVTCLNLICFFEVFSTSSCSALSYVGPCWMSMGRIDALHCSPYPLDLIATCQKMNIQTDKAGGGRLST